MLAKVKPFNEIQLVTKGKQMTTAASQNEPFKATFLELSPAFDGTRGWLWERELNNAIDPDATKFTIGPDECVCSTGEIFVFAYPRDSQSQQ
jgi:hypothetical protein